MIDLKLENALPSLSLAEMEYLQITVQLYYGCNKTTYNTENKSYG
jgi:hypothetical protein